MRKIRYQHKNYLIFLLFFTFPLLSNFVPKPMFTLVFTPSNQNIFQETSNLSNQMNSISSDLLSIKSPLSIAALNINESFEEKLSIINPINNPDITGEDVSIAVLDSGINDSNWIHPNTILDRINVDQSNASVSDQIGHGTLVASIIAKIAPKAGLLSIKVTDESGIPTIENIEAGLRYALTNNVSIIHASLGASDINVLNSTLISTIVKKNISLVVAAGNSGPYGGSITSPAIFNEAIAVGMTYNQTYIPYSSSVGPRPEGNMGPDIVAPGVYIPSYVNRDESQNVSGTSFAAPFVTATVALLQQAFPDISPMTIKTALLSSASFIENVSPSQQGNGVLNVELAYTALQRLNELPLLTFTPRKISSDFIYFGQSINGQDQTYNLGVYSSLNCNLSSMDISTSLPIHVIVPNNVSSNLSIPIYKGFNKLQISLSIPKDLPMETWEGTLDFNFIYKKTNKHNLTNSYLIKGILPVHLENRYPGSRILFYQGYDNDSFIPDGPTGRFSQLHFLMENIFGMQVTGAIRSNSVLSVVGPLQGISSSQGNISAEDLENFEILVLADIEMDLTTDDIAIIQKWVDEGHSLLILSYPSLIEGQTEYLSNRNSINELLEPYDLSVDDDPSKPHMTRFSQASLAPSSPIENMENLMFDFNGTSVTVSPGGYAEVLATAKFPQNDPDDISIAGYWHDPESNGKVVVFGGLEPFSDISYFSPIAEENFYIASQTFRWLIRTHEIPMEINLATNPSLGTSTKIQITFQSVAPDTNFNGTIHEANGSYSQISFEKSHNTYVGTWKPKKLGTAILWLNLHIEGTTPSNGLYFLAVNDPAGEEFFFFFILSSFVIFAVVYYWISSRRNKPRLTLQEQLTMQYKKPQTHVGTRTIERGEICSRCRTPRHNNNSQYCYKCGKEL